MVGNCGGRGRANRGRRSDPSAVFRSAATGAISTVKCRPCVIQTAKEREGNGGGGFSEDCDGRSGTGLTRERRERKRGNDDRKEKKEGGRRRGRRWRRQMDQRNEWMDRKGEQEKGKEKKKGKRRGGREEREEETSSRRTGRRGVEGLSHAGQETNGGGWFDRGVIDEELHLY